ncbi:uncharacterized protein G2W53_008556 [Senna tora]|uniref:Uncharacterized protein n=1 Tax=Senna tora TaxID=362788 RepID=A0A835CFB5_9FABA|nr:uncharacterized protein G2W53_008556 [Senna tora]
MNDHRYKTTETIAGQTKLATKNTVISERILDLSSNKPHKPVRITKTVDQLHTIRNLTPFQQSDKKQRKRDRVLDDTKQFRRDTTIVKQTRTDSHNLFFSSKSFESEMKENCA